MDLRTEPDTGRLRQAALLLEAENNRLASKVVSLTKALALARGEDAASLQLRLLELEAQLAKQNQMLFGRSTEKGEERQAEKPPRAPKTGHGPKAQPNLETVVSEHFLDEPDKICNACGGQLQLWEGQFEEAEEVDVVSRKFVMVKHRRQKYRCQCGGCVDTALGPPKLFPKARYSIDFAIEVAIEKYLDHQPLERQVRAMKREGLDTDSQTLWNYLECLAKLLQPAHDRLHQYVLSQPVIGADETGWRLMGAKDSERSNWYLWALAATNAVVYRLMDSRSADAARAVLQGYSGELVSDGYVVYSALKKHGGAFGLSHCWAHGRREFWDIRDKYPEAKAVIGLIEQLYAIEKECETGPPGDAMRAKLRNEKSRPIVEEIREWLAARRTLPESGLGKAIAYMNGVWPGLIRFLENPRIPLDNNATERALRGPVIGRKNHYGSRSRRGTEVAGLMYSLLESAKLCGIEPKAYLRQAVVAALAEAQIPLPHELAATP